MKTLTYTLQVCLSQFSLIRNIQFYSRSYVISFRDNFSLYFKLIISYNLLKVKIVFTTTDGCMNVKGFLFVHSSRLPNLHPPAFVCFQLGSGRPGPRGSMSPRYVRR